VTARAGVDMAEVAEDGIARKTPSSTSSSQVETGGSRQGRGRERVGWRVEVGALLLWAAATRMHAGWSRVGLLTRDETSATLAAQSMRSIQRLQVATTPHAAPTGLRLLPGRDELLRDVRLGGLSGPLSERRRRSTKATRARQQQQAWRRGFVLREGKLRIEDDMTGRYLPLTKLAAHKWRCKCGT